MRRILSLWLVQLPLDRHIRRGDERVGGAFAITTEAQNTVRLAYLSDQAREAGLVPGLSLPDARAICPHLLSEPDDPAGNEALLRALVRWADQFSPLVSADPPDGLVMDITGCAHLFGGEAEMAETLYQHSMDLRLVARVGIADTKGAARALARFSGRPVTVSPPGRTAEALQGLPIAALQLAPGLVHEIRRTGLQTIGELCTIRPSELNRRYGVALTATIQRSLGQTPDPVTPGKPDPVYAARMTLPEPTGHQEDLEAIILRLSGSVCARLKADGCAARCYRLTLRPVDAREQTLVIGFTRPSACPDAVLRQMRPQLDRLEMPFGADFFRIHADRIEPLYPKQAGFDKRSEQEDDRADLISTLGNRLGFSRIRFFMAADSHIPEREFFTIDAVDIDRRTAWIPSPARRPVRLYAPPERLHVKVPGRPPLKFEWRCQNYETAHAFGPERLSGEWWHDQPAGLRDYWRVETKQGPRLWLLTWPGQESTAWYMAGRFA